MDKSPSESTLNADGLRDHESIPYESKQQMEETVEKRFPQQSLSYYDRMVPASENKQPSATMEGSNEPQLLRAHSQESRSTKTKSSVAAKTGTTKASLMLASIFYCPGMYAKSFVNCTWIEELIIICGAPKKTLRMHACLKFSLLSLQAM